MNKGKNKFKTKNFCESINHAWDGILIMLKERNMKIYFLISIIFIILNIIRRSTPIEWVILVILIFLVFVAETINTALENIIDKLQPDKDIYAKNAKDLAAACVLFFGILFFICEGILLIW